MKPVAQGTIQGLPDFDQRSNHVARVDRPPFTGLATCLGSPMVRELDRILAMEPVVATNSSRIR